jgi:oligoribonuclease NrnB/cAMP/cGMP phosphodiesterase (DHH superfamily)
MKCFYHNDIDGRCAGAIVAHFEKNYNREDYFEVNYVDPLPLDLVQPGELVYFVDYSFKQNTIHQLQELLNKNCQIVWIDHHTSSLELQKYSEYAWVKNIPGLRDESRCGAALTYMYLNMVDFDKIPLVVKLVDDYDRWVYALDPDTTHFKLGVEATEHGALDKIWKQLLYSDMNKVFSLIKNGKVIKKYVTQDLKGYRELFGYETEIAGHKCFAVNRQSNSWIFGEKYNEYPVTMVYSFNGELFVYSIYSGDPNISCSKIAESYGGGGHSGAAGFALPDMPFKKTN